MLIRLHSGFHFAENCEHWRYGGTRRAECCSVTDARLGPRKLYAVWIDWDGAHLRLRSAADTLPRIDMTSTKFLGAFFLAVAAVAGFAGFEALVSRTHEWAALVGYSAIAGAVLTASLGAFLLAMANSKRRSDRPNERRARSDASPLAAIAGSALGAASLYVAFAALVDGAIRGGRKVGIVTFQQHPLGFCLRVAFVLVIGLILLRVFLPSLLRIFRHRNDN